MIRSLEVKDTSLGLNEPDFQVVDEHLIRKKERESQKIVKYT